MRRIDRNNSASVEEVLTTIKALIYSGYMVKVIDYLVLTIIPEDYGVQAGGVYIELLNSMHRGKKAAQDGDFSSYCKELASILAVAMMLGRDRRCATALSIGISLMKEGDLHGMDGDGLGDAIQNLAKFKLKAMEEDAGSLALCKMSRWLQACLLPLNMKTKGDRAFTAYGNRTQVLNKVATVLSKPDALRVLEYYKQEMKGRTSMLCPTFAFLMDVYPGEMPTVDVDDEMVEKLAKSLASPPPTLSGQVFLNTTPTYAFDKHTGKKNAGYEEFFGLRWEGKTLVPLEDFDPENAGTYFPPAVQSPDHQAHVEMQYIDCYRRLAYEQEHGVGTSKGAKRRLKIKGLEVKGKAVKRRFNDKDTVKTHKSKDELPVNGPMEGTLAIAQPLTSLHKTPVHLGKEVVYKGPYPVKKRLRLSRSAEGHEAFKALASLGGGESTVLDAWTETVNGGDYVAWPSIGDAEAMVIEPVTTKLHYLPKVARRGTYVQRMSELTAGEVTRDMAVKALTHLYHRYLLGVGDSQLVNVLLGKDGQVYGVDIEEQRRSTGADLQTMLFTKKLRKGLWPVYKQFVKDLYIINEWEISILCAKCKEMLLWSSEEEIKLRAGAFKEIVNKEL